MIFCSLLGGLVLGGDGDDAVGVDVEGHLDLRHAAGRRRDAGQLELAEDRLSAAISRSPWKTWIVTAVWLSSAVEKTWLFLVGMVVLRSISG